MVTYLRKQKINLAGLLETKVKEPKFIANVSLKLKDGSMLITVLKTILEEYGCYRKKNTSMLR